MPSKQLSDRDSSPTSAAHVRSSAWATVFIALRTRQAPVPQERSSRPVRPTTDARSASGAVRIGRSDTCSCQEIGI